jgi:hypothetical protein
VEKYEYFREEGWKCYFNDIAFPNGDAPPAKVISYFIKSDRGKSLAEGVSEENTLKREDITFDKVCSLEWATERLNRTLQYKRKWYGDKDIYNFAVLQNYLDQCKLGGYSKCLLSWQEVYMIKDKKGKTIYANE